MLHACWIVAAVAAILLCAASLTAVATGVGDAHDPAFRASLPRTAATISSASPADDTDHGVDARWVTLADGGHVLDLSPTPPIPTALPHRSEARGAMSARAPPADPRR